MLVAACVLVYWHAGLLMWAVYFVVVGGNIVLDYRAWRRGGRKP
jgi:hypothetical protein